MKKQIGVIFGSRSCEREVAIISAIQLMRYADTEQYDIIPVYIDEHGNWYTGEKLKEISTFQPCYKGNRHLMVKEGDKVAAGKPIAASGGDHLCFEIWHDGQAVDPVQFVKF